MARQVNAEGLALIRDHEGLRLVAYDDRRPNVVLREGDRIVGTLTIGHGHTGPDVYIGLACTVEQAERWLREDIAEAEAVVALLVKVPLNDNEFAALVSFTFNLGGAAFRGSTLLRKLNAEDRAGAAAEFARWNKAGGKVLPGLVRRRAAEAALFLRPVGPGLPIQATDTPERVQAPPSAAEVGKVGSGVATGAGAVLAAAGAPWPVIVALVVVATALAVGGFLLAKRKGWLA